MYRTYLPWHIEQSKRMVVVKALKSPKALGEKITLLNWNVHKNNHALAWLQDFTHILYQYDPSIIVFQEYQTMNQRSILDKRHEYSYGFFPNMILGQNQYGLINAAKSDIVEFVSYTTEGVEPIIKTPKITLQTKYLLHHGGFLRMVNVHMINFVKIKKFLAQITQIEEACLCHDDTMILSGDFNTWNKKRMHILEKMTNSCGLRSVVFKDNIHQKRPFPFPLDHVFYRGLTFLRSEVMHHVTTSDHKPMIIEFLAK